MNDTVIFDNGILADGDLAKITPDNRARPYRAILTDLNITDNISRLANKGRLMYFRGFTIETANHNFLPAA
jgi:hypothetical protein